MGFYSFSNKTNLRLPAILFCFLFVLFAGCSAEASNKPEAAAPDVDYPVLSLAQCVDEAELVVMGRITGRSEMITTKTTKADPVAKNYYTWTVEPSKVYLGSVDKVSLTVCAIESDFLREEGTVILFLTRTAQLSAEDACYCTTGGPSGIYYCEEDTVLNGWGSTIEKDDFINQLIDLCQPQA